MKSLRYKIATYLAILVLLLSYLPTSMVPIEIAFADGVRLPGGATLPLPDVSTEYGAPDKMKEIKGTIGLLKDNIDDIYPTAKGKKRLYWGDNLPFDLVDKETGQKYAGYCAQSYSYASKNMTAKGLVTDARHLKMIDLLTGHNPENPGDAAQIAIQIVMWGALNNNWSPDLFSKNHVSTDINAYSGMKAVGTHVQTIAANWDKIIGGETKTIKPIQPAKDQVKSICHPEDPEKHGALAEVQWKFAGGGQVGQLWSIADITYDGFSTVYNGSNPNHHAKIKEFGITPKKNADYLLVKNPMKPGSIKINAKIKYKNDYAPFNKLTLIHYDGGSSNQPFILPKVGKTEYPLVIEWDCDPRPKCPPDHPNYPDCEPPPPDENGPSCGKSESTSTDVRWYNMPTAYGEMKDGVGYNEIGTTMTGTYATTRAGEEFEAMNGVPTTERFYVNLGGTEGFMDVTYSLEELTQDFVVEWQTPWVIPGDPGSSGTAGVFNSTSTWDFKAMHIKEATFRVFGDGSVSQPDLGLDLQIVNSKKEVGSYNLQPNPSGLEVGPGVGDSTFNIGATSAWEPCQGVFTTATVTGRVAVRSDGLQEALDKANAVVGQIFAQNDALEITIQGTKYTFVPEVNKKMDKAFNDKGGELDATDGKLLEYFNPIGEKWDVWGHVPIAGYNGNPEDDGERSPKGNPLLLEDLPLPITKANGIYEFQKSEDGNVLDYEAIVTTIKGPTKDLMGDVSELNDGKSKGTGTVYGSAKDPIDKEKYIDGNRVLLQYTNWQVPVTTPNPNPNNLQFKHSNKVPDGNPDETLEDNPRYRSINPILLHNPTTALYSWISDIPDSQLQDQRIDAENERFSKHPSTQTGNPRQYVDYDFQLTIPNVAAFNKHWSQAAKNSDRAGFEDLDFTNPGTLGKGYKGDAVGQITDRSYSNPYLGASGWNVAKWTNAKYVKFPYDVYYYKNSDEKGGDGSGFYDAGTWIKLYDNNQTVSMEDPIQFNFHVTSNQKDIKDGIIYVASETINSQGSLTGNGEALYESGEQYINSTRNPEATTLGQYTTQFDGEAMYSAVNQMNIDAIGRIGNLVVSDTSDPAWSDVFWKTKNGKVDTTSPVSKNYGIYYNIYESMVIPNDTGFPAYNRFHTLDDWMNEMTPIHSLPLTTNVLTKGKEKQTVKLGYSIGGSVQTVGDYDYADGMWIYPQNQLAGKFDTGNAGQHFKLMSSDPFMSGARYQEYYDSNVNNTLHGNGGALGKNYNPTYKHNLSLSLADPRVKMSAWEKSSPSYQVAAQKGPTKKEITGTPSWIQVPQSLRTYVGKDESQGRWGIGNENGNNTSGSKGAASSANCECSNLNSQKWNWNYSLPQNTQVWFDQNPANTNKLGVPKFEKPTKNQYIITSMAYRTKVKRTTFPGEGDAWQTEIKLPAIEYGDQYLVHDAQSIPDWDLTMYTNTGVNTNPDILTHTKDVPEGITPSTDPKVPYTYDPSQEGDISAPMIDIIWWNYSKPSTTDKDTIGTH